MLEEKMKGLADGENDTTRKVDGEGIEECGEEEGRGRRGAGGERKEKERKKRDYTYPEFCPCSEGISIRGTMV